MRELVKHIKTVSTGLRTEFRATNALFVPSGCNPGARLDNTWDNNGNSTSIQAAHINLEKIGEDLSVLSADNILSEIYGIFL